jgi:saccharopine dehydrogenase-like NADP-dependent oxidoreductase
MRALFLGGTGNYGKSAAVLYAHKNLITEIGLASRNLETAQRIAVEVDDKVHAVRVDIKNLPRLSSVL